MVATDELQTAGPPARIRLIADHNQVSPGWDHVDYLEATVVDAHGIIVPSASNRITFTIQGPGTIAAVDNADNTSHESFRGEQRSAYEGRCIAFLRAEQNHGGIVVTAAAPGLRSGSISVTAVPEHRGDDAM